MIQLGTVLFCIIFCLTGRRWTSSMARLARVRWLATVVSSKYCVRRILCSNGARCKYKKREKSHFKSKKCEKFHTFVSKSVIIQLGTVLFCIIFVGAVHRKGRGGSPCSHFSLLPNPTPGPSPLGKGRGGSLEPNAEQVANVGISSAIQKNLLLPPCASKMQSGSKTRFCSKDHQLTNSCLAVKVPLRGTFILLLCGPSGEDLRPSYMVFRTNSFFEAF